MTTEWTRIFFCIFLVVHSSDSWRLMPLICTCKLPRLVKGSCVASYGSWTFLFVFKENRPLCGQQHQTQFGLYFLVRVLTPDSDRSSQQNVLMIWAIGLSQD